jgi:Domain of Unknown Function with PDB structure (DUF3857)
LRGHDLLFALSVVFAAVATSQEVFVEVSPPTPAVIVKMTVDDVVEPDGSYTSLFHVERLATNQSAAQKIAQQTVSYSESMETAEIVEAFTRKPDGKVLDVDRTQIFAQAPPGSPQVPMFTDRKQKVIVFPDVAPNDLVVFTIKQSHKPSFTGQFSTGDVFQRGLAFENARVSISLPKPMPAHVQALGVDHQVEDIVFCTRTLNPQSPLPQPCRPGTLIRNLRSRPSPIMPRWRPPIDGQRAPRRR